MRRGRALPGGPLLREPFCGCADCTAAASPRPIGTLRCAARGARPGGRAACGSRASRARLPAGAAPRPSLPRSSGACGLTPSAARCTAGRCALDAGQQLGLPCSAATAIVAHPAQDVGQPSIPARPPRGYSASEGLKRVGMGSAVCCSPLRRWTVIRTSNAYVFRDPQPQLAGVPAAKSENRTGTPNQEDSMPLLAPTVDPDSLLERTLARFSAAVAAKKGIEQGAG